MIRYDSKKARNIFIISMISVFMGQLYISPFNIVFRLTLAVFFMSLFLIYFKNYSIIMITMSVGFSTFLFRSIVYYLGSSMSFEAVVIQYIPVLSYYLFFGLLFKILKVRNYLDQPFNSFLSLWVCDSIPNIIEALIRRIWEIATFDKLVITIILVGAVRTIMTLTIYYLSKYYISKFQKNEREKYYREIIVFISKLKTELFLLNKSRNDIEETVAYVHHYYDEIEDEYLKAPLLKIAKDIHEIKKDYLRVIAGMNSIFNSDTIIKYMSIKDILYIVEDNASKLISHKKKKVVMSVNYDEIFLTNEFYSIISILNNLTVNSIDAIYCYGEIHIETTLEADEVVFLVEDTGEGIPEEKMEVIFKSGYTTKYDNKTGKMSTGLGLSHVQNIVTEYFKGTIDVMSEINKGTKITIRIPREIIIRKVDVR